MYLVCSTSASPCQEQRLGRAQDPSPPRAVGKPPAPSASQRFHTDNPKNQMGKNPKVKERQLSTAMIRGSNPTFSQVSLGMIYEG